MRLAFRGQRESRTLKTEGPVVWQGERSQGFLQEDLMARGRRICMMEDQGLADMIARAGVPRGLWVSHGLTVSQATSFSHRQQEASEGMSKGRASLLQSCGHEKKRVESWR